MRALAESDLASRAGRMRQVEQVLRFAVVGIGATLLYAFLALQLTSGGGDPAIASATAYALAAIFSYTGHKFFTFVSGGAHRIEIPRFVIVTLSGLALSYLLPTLVVGVLGWPVSFTVALICVVVPFVNYFVLRLWVFSSSSGRA